MNSKEIKTYYDNLVREYKKDHMFYVNEDTIYFAGYSLTTTEGKEVRLEEGLAYKVAGLPVWIDVKDDFHYSRFYLPIEIHGEHVMLPV